MPKKRPNTHITSTKSEKKLMELIPDEWTCEQLNKDYGLDFLVEIFQDEYTTGNQFYIQLKGTTQTFKGENIIWPLSTDTLDYYSSLALPILLVICQVDTDEIWGKWMNSIDYNSDNDSKNIKINKSNILTEEKLYEIRDQFYIDMKYNIKLELNNNNEISSKYNKRLEKSLDRLYLTGQLRVRHVKIN